MDEVDRKQLYSTAWRHWGADIQLDIFIEEILEFIHATLKARRNGIKYPPNVPHEVLEELADMCICIEQIKFQMKKMPYGIPRTGINKQNLWDDQVIVLKWQKVHAFKDPKDMITINWNRTFIKLIKLCQAIYESRMDGEIFTYKFSDKLASVLLCMKQIRNEMKKYPRASKNHIVGDNGNEWDSVMEIKEQKLERLKSRLMDSISSKHDLEGVANSVFDKVR